MNNNKQQITSDKAHNKRRTRNAAHVQILWWMAVGGDKERYEVAFDETSCIALLVMQNPGLIVGVSTCQFLIQ